MKIWIGLLPNTAEIGLAGDMARELKATKAALAYGDEALSSSYTLQSAIVCNNLLEPKRLRWRELVASLDRFLRFVESDVDVRDARRELRKLARKRSVPNNSARKRLLQLAQALKPLAVTALEEFASSEIGGIQAVEGFHLDSITVCRDVDEHAAVYIKWLLEGMADHETYPLLDARISEKILAMHSLRSAEGPSEARRKLAETVSQNILLGSLPFAEMATLQETTEIRKSLEGPLVRYRALISKMTSGMESEPWTPEFKHDVKRFEREELRPAIIDINEQFAQNSLVRHIFNRSVVDPPSISKNGMFASTATGIAYLASGIAPLDVSGVVPIVAGAFSVLASVASALVDRAKAQSAAKACPQYFFHVLSGQY